MTRWETNRPETGAAPERDRWGQSTEPGTQSAAGTQRAAPSALPIRGEAGTFTNKVPGLRTDVLILMGG